MRVSRETMARHRQEIIVAASKMLRQRGIDRMSVADLMQEVGLTHGGFYRHFESKDALVAEATTAAFHQLLDAYKARSEKSGPRAALESYIGEYLSPGHVQMPERGCPVAAYGTDVTREGDLVRDAFAKSIEMQLEQIAFGLPGTPKQRRARAIELLSLLVGAVVTARASNSEKGSREVLALARTRASQLIDASNCI